MIPRAIRYKRQALRSLRSGATVEQAARMIGYSGKSGLSMAINHDTDYQLALRESWHKRLKIEQMLSCKKRNLNIAYPLKRISIAKLHLQRRSAWQREHFPSLFEDETNDKSKV